MKVILATADSQYIHSNLAVRYLKKHTEGLDCNVRLIETTINDDPDIFLESIISEAPQIVVFSCYIWNITYLARVMNNLRIVLPECIIAAGGPEVAYNAVKFLEESACDLVMATEGEAVFPELLRFYMDHPGQMPLSIKGLYIKQAGGIIHTGNREALHFDLVKFPYSSEDLADLTNKIIYYEAQRGCPFRCSYCLSSIDKRLRKHDLARVKAELKFFMDHQVPLVKFVDRTFNADEEYAYQIWQYLWDMRIAGVKAGRETKTRFHFEIEAGILSQRQIQLLCEVPEDLFQIEAGIQSTDSEVLRLINRTDNFSRAGVNLKRISDAGKVHVHADLIVGLPGDTIGKIITSFNDCMGLNPGMLQLGFLKILHGTPIKDAAERFGIKYRPYPPYEVLLTDDLSYEKISQFKKYDEIVNKYWNTGQFRNSMRYLLTKYESPFSLFANIQQLYAEAKSKKDNLANEDYYSLLLNLKNGQDVASGEVLGELVRFDYSLTHRKGYLPDTLKNEKYNSIKTEIRIPGKVPQMLKGSARGYRIDVLEFFSTGTVVYEETFVFTSLADRKIYRVRQNKYKDFEVLDSINPRI